MLSNETYCNYKKMTLRWFNYLVWCVLVECVLLNYLAYDTTKPFLRVGNTSCVARKPHAPKGSKLGLPPKVQ